MERDTERDLIEAWRQGNLAAAQAFVRTRQAEALTIAYLLTGDRDRARGLACSAFQRFFQSSRTLDPDADMRSTLLVHLGRRYLRGEYQSEPSHQPELLAGTGPRKYGVENLRDRTLAALGRLDERERLALVLGEVGGFEPERLNQVLERGNTALVAPVETGRQRIRHSLDIPQQESVRPALLEAGFDGPREDLWPHLEEPLNEIWGREKRRDQMLTYALIAGVMLVALVGIALLFGDNLFDSGNGDTDAAAEPPVIVATEDEIEPDQPAPSPPTPTPSPTPLPAGDVPDTLLAEIRHDSETENTYSSLAVYNAGRNGLDPLPDEDERMPSTLSDTTGISPDGEQIVMLRGEWLEESVRYTATSFDTATLERQWHIEMGTFDVIPNGGISVRMAMTLTSERIYVAILGQDDPDHARVIALDRATGEQRETVEVSTSPVSISMSFRGSVYLYAPADESRLFLAIEVWDRLSTGIAEAHLHSIRLPTLDVIDTSGRSRIDDGRGFPLPGARLTPDGESLYTLTSITERWPPKLLFHNVANGETSLLDLPFRNDHELTYPVLSTILSNDGLRLYVIDRVSGNVAIVNLTEQRLERFFPIDTGTFGSQFGVGTDQFVFGWGNVLSLDGERLYIAAGIGDQNQLQNVPDRTGVWVIDLHEWKIVDFWPVTGGTLEIFAGPDERWVLVRHWHYDEPDNDRFPYRISRVGPSIEMPVETPGNGLSADYSIRSFVELYRSQHGRSPTVGGTEPHDLDTYSTLPRVEALAPPNVVAGVSTTIGVRVLDPAEGGTLDSEREGVRFDPASTVTIFLKSEGQPDGLVVMANVAPGEYQASTVLPTTGAWTIDVTATAPDGTTATSSNAGAFEVAPTFIASDGKRYQFHLRSIPATPVVRESTTIRLELVDVENGTPLPEGIEILADQPELDQPLASGMPDRIDATLAGPERGGFRTALLYRISPGVYEGTVSLGESGIWQATVRFQSAGGTRIDIPAGTFQVVDTT